jgi:hypothetical protein
VDTLVALKWPIAVVVIVMFLALLFRKSLANWIRRWQRLRTGIGKLKTEIESPSEPSTEVPQDITWNSSEVSHIYWLGHDLMYLLAVLNIAGSPEEVRHGFRQSMSNLRKLGLPPTYEAKLQALSQTYNQKNSDPIGEQVAQFRMEIGNLIEKLKH